MINRFNELSSWVSSIIVKGETITERVNRLKILINVADSLRRMGNFNTVRTILAGIRHVSVNRLKSTFEALPPEFVEVCNS